MWTSIVISVFFVRSDNSTFLKFVDLFHFLTLYKSFGTEIYVILHVSICSRNRCVDIGCASAGQLTQWLD